jgi:hypothetical protein
MPAMEGARPHALPTRQPTFTVARMSDAPMNRCCIRRAAAASKHGTLLTKAQATQGTRGAMLVNLVRPHLCRYQPLCRGGHDDDAHIDEVAAALLLNVGGRCCAAPACGPA